MRNELDDRLFERSHRFVLMITVRHPLEGAACWRRSRCPSRSDALQLQWRARQDSNPPPFAPEANARTNRPRGGGVIAVPSIPTHHTARRLASRLYPRHGPQSSACSFLVRWQRVQIYATVGPSGAGIGPSRAAGAVSASMAARRGRALLRPLRISSRPPRTRPVCTQSRSRSKKC